MALDSTGSSPGARTPRSTSPPGDLRGRAGRRGPRLRPAAPPSLRGGRPAGRGAAAGDRPRGAPRPDGPRRHGPRGPLPGDLGRAGHSSRPSSPRRTSSSGPLPGCRRVRRVGHPAHHVTAGTRGPQAAGPPGRARTRSCSSRRACSRAPARAGSPVTVAGRTGRMPGHTSEALLHGPQNRRVAPPSATDDDDLRVRQGDDRGQDAAHRPAQDLQQLARSRPRRRRPATGAH